jgi:hypothetical protein
VELLTSRRVELEDERRVRVTFGHMTQCHVA